MCDSRKHVDMRSIVVTLLVQSAHSTSTDEHAHKSQMLLFLTYSDKSTLLSDMRDCLISSMTVLVLHLLALHAHLCVSVRLLLVR